MPANDFKPPKVCAADVTIPGWVASAISIWITSATTVIAFASIAAIGASTANEPALANKSDPTVNGDKARILLKLVVSEPSIKMWSPTAMKSWSTPWSKYAGK